MADLRRVIKLVNERRKKNLLKLMGIWEDKREPATAYFPSAIKCPVKDCEDRGKYTNCYLIKKMHECYIHRSFIQS